MKTKCICKEKDPDLGFRVLGFLDLRKPYSQFFVFSSGYSRVRVQGHTGFFRHHSF
jgi:hypothetical protein